MNIFEESKADLHRILTEGDPIEIQLRSPSGSTATVKGTSSRHHLSVNDDGVSVNSLNVTVNLSQKSLVDEGYPFRDLSDNVSLLGHTVKVKDSSDTLQSYTVIEFFPDDTIHNIVCLLERKASDFPSPVLAVDSALVLTWTFSGSGHTGFSVYRSINGEAYSVIGSVADDVLTYTDLTANTDQAYFYKVAATEGGEHSDRVTGYKSTAVADPSPVTVNSAAFGDTTNGQTFDVPVVNTSDEAKGAKNGAGKWEIPASIITDQDSVPLAAVPAGNDAQITILKPLTLDFTVDNTNPDTDEQVTFTPSGDISGATLYWDFGDGVSQTADGNPVTHSYTSAASISPMLRAIKSSGESGEITKTDYITVVAPSNVYPLDTISGFVLTAGLRQMKSSTSAAMFKLERSSDQSEKWFFPNALAFLGLDSIDSVGTTLASWVGSNSAYLVEALNEGTIATNFSQSSVGTRPKVVDNGVLVVSGDIACMHAVDQGLTTPAVNVANTRSTFIVCEEVGAGGASYSNWILQTLASYHQLYGSYQSSLSYFTNAPKSTGVTAPLGGLGVISVHQTASAGKSYLNGTEIASWGGLTGATNAAFGFLRFGASSWANAKSPWVGIAENLSETDHQSMDGLLKQVFGIL